MTVNTLGRLFVVVGPSGAGKDTLLAGAVMVRPALHWARRVITRPAAATGEPYEGVTEAEFSRRLAAGEFALHWRAHDLGYGVPFAQLAARGEGRDVVMNGSRGALADIARLEPALRVIVVTAPPDVLAARLMARGREAAPDMAARLARGGFDLPPGLDAATVVNDGTPAAGVQRLLALLDPSADKTARPFSTGHD